MKIKYIAIWAKAWRAKLTGNSNDWLSDQHADRQWWYGTGGQIFSCHYNDVKMSTIASQITSLTTVYSTVYSGADQIKHQSSASLTFVWGIHRGPVNSPHKGPVKRKMFPFDDVIMILSAALSVSGGSDYASISVSQWNCFWQKIQHLSFKPCMARENYHHYYY